MQSLIINGFIKKFSDQDKPTTLILLMDC